MNLTEARKAFAPDRVPFTSGGVAFEAVEPSLALRVSLAREKGLAADLPLVSAVVVMPGTDERVFPSPGDLLAISGSKATALIEQVRGICERWTPAKPDTAAASPEEVIAAREA